MCRVLALLALVTAACAPAAPTTPSAPGSPGGPTTPQLAEQQTLVIGYPNLATVLDPQSGVGSGGGRRMYDIYDTLVMPEPSGKGVLPAIANEWKQIDATTWQLGLRRDMKFHDGSPLTSADVVFSWDRSADPSLRSSLRGLMVGVTEITAIDAATVQVKTRQPDPLFLKRLQYLAVVPKAVVERLGNDEFAQKPIGSGPFKVKEFRREDRLILTANTEHAFRKPRLTEITIRWIPEGNARIQGLKLGEIDVTHQMSIEQGDQMRRDGFQVDVRPVAIYGAYLDTKVEGTPLADKRVRQAVNYAVDRQTLSKTIFRDLAKPVGTVVLDGIFGAPNDLKPYTYDLAKARELLAQAGYANGFKATLGFWAFSSEIQPMALYLQSQLRQLNIEIDLAPTEIGGYGDQLNKRKPPPPFFLDAGNTFIPLMDAERSIQFYWSQAPSGDRYGNAEFDRLFVAQRTELDPVKREELLKQAIRILQEDPPFLPLVTFNQVSGYRKDVQGILPFSPDGDWTPFHLIVRTK